MERVEQSGYGSAGEARNVIPASDVFDFTPDSDGSGSRGSGGNGGSGGDIDPAAPYGRKADGTPRQKRGRKPGGNYANNPGKSQAGIPAVDAIAGTLYAIHGAIAALTRISELELSEDEAKKLAHATATAAEVSGATIDPRAAAFVNLAVVAASIYGPKAMRAYVRIKQERARDDERQAARA